jgi:hypothetical protein
MGLSAQPPQSLARAEGVCWNIYLASVHIIQLSHPGEKAGKLTTNPITALRTLNVNTYTKA